MFEYPPKLTVQEIEDLAEEVERVRPWRTGAYQLAYFQRRWAMTIWVAMMCYPVMPEPLYTWMAIGYAFVFELLAAPAAYDLRMTTGQLVQRVYGDDPYHGPESHWTKAKNKKRLWICLTLFALIYAISFFGLIKTFTAELFLLFLTAYVVFMRTFYGYEGLQSFYQARSLKKGVDPRFINLNSFQMDRLETVNIWAAPLNVVSKKNFRPFLNSLLSILCVCLFANAACLTLILLTLESQHGLSVYHRLDRLPDLLIYIAGGALLWFKQFMPPAQALLLKQYYIEKHRIIQTKETSCDI